MKLSLFDFVDTSVEVGVNKSEEYVQYESQIISFGIGKSTVAWDFSQTKEKGIWGDTLLLVVVKAPKGNKVIGRFLLGAEVSSHLSNWMPVPKSKGKTKAVEAENMIHQNNLINMIKELEKQIIQIAEKFYRNPE